MSVLLPWFLGGLAFIGIPILIHRIRRPERETVKFSSLMFVPIVPKEVIERRRIQHLLLLLLRILLVVLVALAFSRPFWTEKERVILGDSQPLRHVILVDTSLSMAMNSRMKEARDAAQAILAGIPAGEEVALLEFNNRVVVKVDFQKGSRASLVTAIGALEPRPLRGDYALGLRIAESKLLGEAAPEEQGMVHLVSDFQIQPALEQAWRLSGRIQFQGYRVGIEKPVNLSITQASFRRVGETGLQLAAQVKLWESDQPQKVEIRFRQRDPSAASSPPVERVLEPGSASLAVFDLPWNGIDPVTGVLEIEQDALSEDNLRYVHWIPDPKKPVNLVSQNTHPEIGSAAWFLQKALSASATTPWNVRTLDYDAWRDSLAQNTEWATLWVEDAQTSKSARDGFLDYVRSGGKALVILAPETPDDFLAAAGVRLQTMANQPGPSSLLESWEWVAFEHPVFAGFGSARFNDFSQIRFFETRNLILEGSSTQALGKTAGATLVAEANLGQGKMIVWGFMPNLKATNLPRHIKFVPILEETLLYLTPNKPDTPQLEVGTSIAQIQNLLPPATQSLRFPGERIWEKSAPVGAFDGLETAGWVDLNDSEQTSWHPWATLNTAWEEGDTQQWTVSEFALKLTASSSLPTLAENEVASKTASMGLRREFGYTLLVLLGAILLLETWLAFRLSKTQPTQSPAEVAV